MAKHVKILIVDDEPAMLNILARSLNKRFELFVASSAKDALEIAETHCPDLILLDIMMPGMDGLTLLKSIRDKDWARDMAIVLLTGDSSESTHMLGLQYGADDFITKPFSLKLLELRIDNLLAKNKAQAEFKQALIFLEEAESVANLGYWVMDSASKDIELSSQAIKMLGILKHVQMNMTDFESYVYEEDRPAFRAFWQAMSCTKEIIELEHRLVVNDQIKWVRQRVNLNRNVKKGKLVATMLDISDQKFLQLKLDKLAHYDTLTDLPNRTYFYQQLEQQMHQVIEDDKRLVLLFLDLDGFKDINDSLGHEAGDHLLHKFGLRLKTLIDPQSFVARYGGDEFVILKVMPLYQTIDSSYLTNLLAMVAETYQYHGHDLNVTASIGVVYHDKHNKSEPQNLVKQADKAMYLAKQSGKNRIFGITEDLSATAEVVAFV